MQGIRDTEKLARARDNLRAIADDIQAVIDGQATQKAVANAHGMDPNTFSRMLRTRFEPYVKKEIVAAGDVPGLLNAAMGPADRMMADILGVELKDDALAVLPEFDPELLLYVAGTTLTEREAHAMELKYGYGRADRPHGNQEIGREFYVTGERAREICAKALRKMRHPSRLKKVFPMLTDIGSILVDTSQSALADAARGLTETVTAVSRASQMRELAGAIEKSGYRPELMDAGRQLLTEGTGVPFRDPASITLEDMDVSVRAYNCCKRAGLNTAKDILDAGTEKLMAVRNLGRRGMEEVRDKVLQLTGCVVA